MSCSVGCIILSRYKSSAVERNIFLEFEHRSGKKVQLIHNPFHRKSGLVDLCVSLQPPRTVESRGDRLSKLHPFLLDLFDRERCPCNRPILATSSERPRGGRLTMPVSSSLAAGSLTGSALTILRATRRRCHSGLHQRSMGSARTTGFLMMSGPPASPSEIARDWPECGGNSSTFGPSGLIVTGLVLAERRTMVMRRTQSVDAKLRGQ